MAIAAKKTKPKKSPKLTELKSLEELFIRVGRQLTPPQIFQWVRDHGCHHVIQEDCLEFDKELKTSVLMSRRADLFLALPLSSIFNPERPTVANERKSLIAMFDVKEFGVRKELLEQISQKLIQAGAQESLVNEIRLVADEMLSYVVFNAAQGELQAPKDYTEDEPPKALAEINPATIFLGADQSRFVIGCRDPHGTLNGHSLISNLDRYFNKELEVGVRTAEESASTEAFQMVLASAAFYAGFRPGQASVICCAFPKKMSRKKREQQPKNFHYFIQNF